jgi:hypothetical protein
VSGRIRTIKPEWLEDERLAAASDEARVLSVALILMADDHGRGRAATATIAAGAWRYQMERDDGVHAPEILARASRAIRELVAIEFADLYEVNGQRYFAIRNWSKHQKVDRPSKPRVPVPETTGTILVSEFQRDPRETLARPSEQPRETLATDLRPPTTDQYPDPEACEAVVYDRLLGVSAANESHRPAGPPPEGEQVGLSTASKVIAAFDDAWRAATGGPGQGLNPQKERQRATEVWRWAIAEAPGDPLGLVRRAAVAACRVDGFRALGSPWAAFAGMPGRHLVGPAGQPADPLLEAQRAAQAEYDRAISDGRNEDAAAAKAKVEAIAAKRRAVRHGGQSDRGGGLRKVGAHG